MNFPTKFSEYKWKQIIFVFFFSYLLLSFLISISPLFLFLDMICFLAFFLLSIIFFIIFLFTLVSDIINKRVTFIYPFLGTLIFVATLLTGREIVSLEKEWSKQSAQPIIDALDSFHLEKNYYPENLEILIPKYLNEIPKSNVGFFGNHFRYSLSNKDNYFLSFEAGTWEYFNYVPKKRVWYSDS